MAEHDTIETVMLSGFIVVVAVFLAVALRTGKAYYGGSVVRMYYFERGKSPIPYWLTVAFTAFVLVDGTWALLSGSF
jgi:hypothetical protein